MFTDEADFSETQKTAILGALSGFPTNELLRFRSSTNVEDSEHFVGAGLYSSYSGCVLDDTDGGEDGPSHCDPSNENERGVFRAMRKVYASFYNTNAFVERLRHGVDESQVGMAILVHPSYPEEIEAANGVAIAQAGSPLMMVSQRGAVSVTNPVDGQLPEIVTFPNGEPRLDRRTQIDPQLGYSVMEWRDDYRALRDVMDGLKQAYVDDGGEGASFDIEYKKLADDSLVVKQFRVIPDEVDITPEFYISVGDSAQFEISKGVDLQSASVPSVFSKHRLKASLELETVSRVLDEEGLSTPFFTLDLQVLEGTEFTRYSGDPLALPGATYEVLHGGQSVRIGWIGMLEEEEVNYELTLTLIAYPIERNQPILPVV